MLQSISVQVGFCSRATLAVCLSLFGAPPVRFVAWSSAVYGLCAPSTSAVFRTLSRDTLIALRVAPGCCSTCTERSQPVVSHKQYSHTLLGKHYKYSASSTLSQFPRQLPPRRSLPLRPRRRTLARQQRWRRQTRTWRRQRTSQPSRRLSLIHI